MSSPSSKRSRPSAPPPPAPRRARLARIELVVGALLALTAGRAAAAQTATANTASTPPAARATLMWLDAGGAQVQQPFSTQRAAGTVGGGLWHARGRVAVAAEGNLTMASDSLDAAQYVVRTTVLPRPWWRADLDASATTVGLVLPGSNGTRALALRQALSWRSVEVIASAGAGATSRLGLQASGHRLAAGTAWVQDTRSGRWRAGAMLMRQATDDFKLMEASGIVLSRVAPSYTVTDRQLELGWERGAWWLQASHAWRAGTGATRGRTTGFHAAAALAMTRSTTVIAQLGEQLADPVRGVPQARYSALVLRWNPVRPPLLRRDARALADDRGGTAAATAVPDLRGEEIVVQRRAGRGEVTLTVLAPATARVEVATSADGWTPRLLTTHDGRAFVDRFTMPTGPHRLALRIDGGPWRAPRGLVAVPDDFGGHAGVLVVP